MKSSRLSSNVWQAFRKADVYVTKIGGENATDLSGNARTIAARRAEGKKQILAVSALRSSDPRYSAFAHETGTDRNPFGKVKPGFNTTSHLIAMAQCLRAGDRDGALALLERVRCFTKEIVSGPSLEHLHAIIDGKIDAFWEGIREANREDVFAVETDWMLRTSRGAIPLSGFGEELAQAVTVASLRQWDIPAAAIPMEGIAKDIRVGLSPDVWRNEDVTRQWIDGMRANIRSQIASLLPANDVLVTGGYVPILGSQRGYSDKTGALLAQAAAETGQRIAYLIEKQEPIRSADPRIVEGTRIVERMTPALALETFGNIHGADGGAIHPDALAMLAQADVDIFVLNPRTAAPGRITRIHCFDPPPGRIEIVALRSVPLALQVRSTRMSGRPGFLRAVTDWFSTNGISIDQVLTSEVTVSFTFNNGGMAPDMIEAFRQYLKEHVADEELELCVIRDRSLMYCLGNNIAGLKPVASVIHALETAGVRDVDFLMQSTREVILATVDMKEAESVLRTLHDVCIGSPQLEAKNKISEECYARYHDRDAPGA